MIGKSIETLVPVSLLLEDPAAKRATLYLKDQLAPASLLALLAQGRLSQTPLHLLYNATPSARGGTLEERVADLQRQQIVWMLQMSSEQMAHTMEPVVRSFSAADPETQARLMSLPSMAGLMAVWFPREAKESGGERSGELSGHGGILSGRRRHRGRMPRAWVSL